MCLLRPAFVHFSSVWVLYRGMHCAMATPVTCYLSREIHTEKRDSEIACVCQCVCVCVFIVGRQYLLDQTSSGSSVHSMASHHTETQSPGHIYCICLLVLFIHSIAFCFYYLLYVCLHSLSSYTSACCPAVSCLLHF